MSCTLRFILPSSSPKMRSFSSLASRRSACASPSSRSAHSSSNRPAPISPITRPSTTTRASLTRCTSPIKSGPPRRPKCVSTSLGSSWMVARRPGTALISACSTEPRTAAARPSVQLPGMCMCRSTKRRWPERRVVMWSKRIAGCSKDLSTLSISFCTSRSTRLSIRPCDDRHTRLPPSRRMLSATAMATSGSSHSQPVTATSPMPTTTPAEVQTSVNRWRASASTAIERCRRADCSMAQASSAVEDRAEHREAQAQAELLQGLRVQQAVDRGPDDRRGRDHDRQRPRSAEEKYSAL